MNNNMNKPYQSQYTKQSKTNSNTSHETYWFQNIVDTIFNLDLAFKMFPMVDMSYAEKINALVRLSIYIGVITSLLCCNYLYLWIPICIMLLTYILYLFRTVQLKNEIEKFGPTAKLNDLPQANLIKLSKYNMMGKDNTTRPMPDLLNIKSCSSPNTNNPFMNPLLFDSRVRNSACDSVDPATQLKIEEEYNKSCIKDASDIFNHNSGRRQFYTVAATTYPNNQTAFANWLYRTGPSCKDGNGAQCVANYYTPLNFNLTTPGYGSSV